MNNLNDHDLATPLPLHENMAPAREHRVGAIRAYAGTAKQLVQDTKSGNLAVYNREFEQGWLCSHALGGTGEACTVTDAVTIVHAAAGCTVYLLHRRTIPFFNPREKVDTEGMRYIPGGAANWYGTNLTEEDVIFGSENKLRETIKMVDRIHHPRCIFITTSCSAAIIGDDIEGVVRSVQPEVNAIIVPIRCEPINSRVPQSGIDTFAHAVLKYLVREPRKRQDDMVNIITRGPQAVMWCDMLHIVQLLARVGIRANNVPGYARTEQLQMMSEAAGSATLCPTAGDYLIKGLKQKYGIPYVRDTMPFGIDKTEEWLRKIARFVHKEKEMEELIAKERDSVMPKIKALREELQGLKVFVSAGPTRALFLPHMLVSDFGMQLVGINTYEWNETYIEDLDELGRVVGNMDFFVHVGDAQTFEMVNYMKKLDFDLALVHRGPPITLLKLGFPVGRVWTAGHSLGKSRGDDLQVGFKGAVAYGRYILRVVKNPAFGKKLSVYAKLPYKKSWYEADAFSKFTELK